MSSEVLTAIGAFLSGVGACAGGYFAIRGVRRRAERLCEERIRELQETFDRGLDRGLGLKHADEGDK